MLNNHQFQTLTVVNENHTDLSESTQLMEDVSSLLDFHFEGIENRLKTGVINKECFAVVRLSAKTSLLIYVNPQFANNPYLYRYSNKTGEIDKTIDYEEFISVLNPGTQAFLELRLDKIQDMDMSRFARDDTIEKVRDLIWEEYELENDDYER